MSSSILPKKAFSGPAKSRAEFLGQIYSVGTPGARGEDIGEQKLDICELASEGMVTDCDQVPTKAHARDSDDGKNKYAPSVWTVFGELAVTTQACNLGQGFPDWKTPQFMLDSLRDAIDSPYHQYTRPAGHPPLVKLLAESYSIHMNRDIDPYREVTVTVGASQALFLALSTLLGAGDEVAMFDPYFDLYLKQVKAIAPGAVPTFIPLGGSSNINGGGVSGRGDEPWALDVEALEATITENTRVLILTSPHNPTGKVFSLEELEAIAEVVRRYPNLVVLSDEVYKYTVYNAKQAGDPSTKGHYHFARLPGMWDRTLTLSSAGKTFSATGWQIGWAVGPEHFTSAIHDLIPCVQFCANTPAQHAFCNALTVAKEPYQGEESYYSWLRLQFATKREILERGLRAAGMEPVTSHGGYFLMAKLPNAHPLVSPAEGDEEPYDWRFCRMLAHEYGVIGIPTSSFFATERRDGNGKREWYARFAFCKKDKTIHEAALRLVQNSHKGGTSSSCK
jgi:kynurenine--oxoglutarate transaminase/cysteine-S-conjugate beta-lyase/glutamine--phenylpyruvate transaminase